MSELDDRILSKYLDGELDFQSTEEVTSQLYSDHNSRERLMQLLTAQVSLRSLGREYLSEEVPQGLLATVRKRKRQKRGRLVNVFSMPFFRYAAAVVLIVAAFFTGRGERRGLLFDTPLFLSLPVALEQVINTTLEFEPSGTVQVWHDRRQQASARVKPVHTYRGREGEFYRMYSLDLEQGNVTRSYMGVARRIGKETWQARVVSLQETAEEI